MIEDVKKLVEELMRDAQVMIADLDRIAADLRYTTNSLQEKINLILEVE